MGAHAVFERLQFSRHSKRIFIPRLTTQVGGPRTFMALLRDGLKSRGWKITCNRYTQTDVALIPIAWDVECLRAWKNNGTRIVQRLDGLFYDAGTGAYDFEKNAEAEQVYRELADGIVFQSDYSKRQCEHFLGRSPANQQVVIRNGTDWKGSAKSRPSDGKWRFVSTGNFRDASMIRPLIEALHGLYENGYTFEWHLLGPVTVELGFDWNSRPYVHHRSSVAREEIHACLEQSHVFLFSFLNPNCPNSVIEACACGLPVVAFDSGALTELCPFNASLLVEVGEGAIHTEDQLQSGPFQNKIVQCLEDFEAYAGRAAEHRNQFALEAAVDAYDQFLQQVV